MRTECAGTAARESDVGMEMNKLKKMVDGILQDVSMVRDRYSQVMRNAQPEKGKEEKPPVVELIAPLAEEIRLVRSKLDDIHYELNEIVNRCEL